MDYQIALTLVPQLGPVKARRLTEIMSARHVFEDPEAELELAEGVGPLMAMHVRSFKHFDEVKRIRTDCDRMGISIIGIGSPEYPFRLKHIPDAPLLLYSKGNSQGSSTRSIGIVGTRQMTTYGRGIVEQFVEQLRYVNVSVHSGLAYGVDALAHKLCLTHRIPTVAYMAHGLDRVYPHRHRAMAQRILDQGGGLVSEYPPRTKGNKYQFPARNRLIAGAVDVVVVVESGNKGGSLITADLANQYDREVMAVPSSITSPLSIGCNNLIKANKAHLMTDVRDLCRVMNWELDTQEVLPELSRAADKLLQTMYSKEIWHLDDLLIASSLQRSELAVILFELELKNCISSLPGTRFRRR